MWNVEWCAAAHCLNESPDAMFVSGSAQRLAKRICVGCPVRTECLAEALDHRVECGVWGGMTERERRSLLARRPDVDSWRRLFEDSRDRQLLEAF